MSLELLIAIGITSTMSEAVKLNHKQEFVPVRKQQFERTNFKKQFVRNNFPRASYARPCPVSTKN